MLSTARPLLDLTAKDLMSRDVITIPRQMSLRAAAHLLAQAHVSGAPVTDENGCCVGILSGTDLVRWLDQSEQSARGCPRGPECVCSDWAVFDPETLPPDSVQRYMTTDLVTAREDTRVGVLARQMLDAHIHRVVVTDPLGRPIGIVSTTDVLAAVARADQYQTADSMG
jgi:CBS-domain-containing membrane protein